MSEEGVNLKLVLLGQEGVGKTSIVRKFCLNEGLKSEYHTTIGMDIYTKSILLGDININLDIYDVNGKAIYNRNLPNLLANSDALIFVYDVGHVGSFEKLKDWIKIVRTMQTSALMVLIGHKTDLSQNFTIDDQTNLMKDYQIVFNTEVSVFSDSINAAFNRIAAEVLSNQESIPNFSTKAPQDSRQTDIFVLRTGSSSDSDGNIFDRPAMNLAEYKLDLLDHPKAGNQGMSSMSHLALNRLSPRPSPKSSPLPSPHGSVSNLLSVANSRMVSARSSPAGSTVNLLSPAHSKGVLGSALSMTKLDRSLKSSSHHLSVPVDNKHQKAIQEVTEKDGSFSVASFIVLKKSAAQDVAVLEKYDTNDMDGTLKFQLLSIRNTKGKSQAVKLSKLINEAKTIKYLFVSSLLCILPAADSIVFVLDYHSSNLQQILNQNNRRMHENGARFYMAEILMGLDYLHEKNIIYKDLNPENVLITETGHIKLVNPIMWNGINDVHGTPGYMAPEVIHQNETSKSSDIWSYACILFELLTGGNMRYSFVDTPFPRDIKDSTYSDMIIHGEGTPIKFPYGVSTHLIDFVNSCLKVNPNQRLGSWKGCMDLKCHPWFKNIPRWCAVEEYLISVPMVPDIYYYDPENTELNDSNQRLSTGSQVSELKKLYFRA